MTVFAKKSLGQNWLTSESALATIISTGDLSPDDTVLEIGPGKGVLTEKILPLVKKVIAIEKDHRLIPELEQKFSQEIKAGKLEVHEEDILNFSPDSLPQGYKVIANIPYYITGQILRQFLETANQPERLVVLVQKEVAERIVARDGKESILSISVKAYGEPIFVKTVPRGAFSPMPNVDSAILAVTTISKNNFQDISEEKFFAALKQGFGQKRKQLKNNLGCSEDQIAACGLEEKVRAEELTVANWLCLAKEL